MTLSWSLEFVGLGLLGEHLLEWQTSLLLAIAKGRPLTQFSELNL